MRIGDNTSSVEYRMNEQFQNFPIFGVGILVFQMTKKIPESSQILKFRKLSNFHSQQTHKISKFLKLFNIEN